MEEFKEPKNIKQMWLDVGCGIDKIPGAIGVDKIALPNVDVVHDLDQVPWPFKDNTFDHIVCKHSLNHLSDLIKAMEEIHRIAKPNAIVEILAPHYSSDNFNTDPTHKFHMGIRTMNYFCEEFKFKYHYYSKARFKMLKRHISFRENITDFRKDTKFNIARIVGFEFIVNKFPRIYERFFTYWFPASEVYFKLQVLK